MPEKPGSKSATTPSSAGRKQTPVAKRSAASSKKTVEKKPAAAKPAGRPGRKPGRRAPGGKSGGKNPSFLLPLFTVWFFAVVVLAGLIYWGWGEGSRMTSPKSRPVESPTTRTASRASSDSSTVRAAVKPPVSSEPSGVRRQSVPRSAERPATTPAPPPSPGPEYAAPVHVDPSPEAPPVRTDPPQEPAAPRDESDKLLTALNTPPPRQEPPAPAPPDLAPSLAKVAIVIDDFGLDLEIARKFLRLPLPVTFSVLPDQPHSREIAEMAHRHGRDVIVHLPMEPHGYPRVNPGTSALLVSMSSGEIRGNLRGVLDANPYASGMNNHMGSRFTEYAQPMESIMEELKRRGLYFFDSYTSPQSVGFPMARRMGVPTGRRDVFLDHVATESFVRSQIGQLIEKARIQGSAIAIGHPHGYTLNVLRQEAGRFQREGVTVVPLKSLMNAGSG